MRIKWLSNLQHNVAVECNANRINLLCYTRLFPHFWWCLYTTMKYFLDFIYRSKYALQECVTIRMFVKWQYMCWCV